MNCPKCKCPNPQGATYCSMCYEILVHSAAEAFLRNAQRDRRAADENPSSTPELLSSVVSSTTAAAQQVDWKALFQESLKILLRYRRIFLGIGIGVGFLFLFKILGSPNTWCRLLGIHIHYDTTPEPERKYLVSFHYDLNTWSERQGQMDTPLQHWRIEELGNVFIDAKKTENKKQRLLTVRPNEWIQIVEEGKHRRSQGIALNHPSMAPAPVLLDSSGVVLKRLFPLSPRIAKGTDFLLPRFPKELRRNGATWTESMAWMESIGDWKFQWNATLHWTLEGMQDCDEGNCARLTCKADLTPRLWEAPRWAAGTLGRLTFDGKAEGVALFELRHGRIYSNSLSYDGIMRLPISDVARIPRSLRVGRKVRGPGTLSLQYANRILIR